MPDSTAVATSDETTEQYAAPRQAVFDAAHRALVHRGLALKVADPAGGILRADTSLSMASWGEYLTVTVYAVTPDITSVTVQSSLKFGLVAWGRNKKNVAQVHKEIGAQLSQHGEPGPQTDGEWHPDPSGRHQHRWWDGKAWTDHVADAGVTGSDPL